MNFYRNHAKRFFDLCLVIPILAVAAPIMLLTGLMVYLDVGRPLFFRATRVGKGAKPFTMYKFRTMKELYDARGNPLPDEQRLTATGALLRKLSLDELPELLNVLRGDMSLVGPRPLLQEYTGRYDSVQIRRLDVPQGVTGWAQINGRNAIGWDAKLSLDVWYVDHIGPMLDLKILFLTAWKIVTREGVSHDGYVNMPEFLGNDSREMTPDEIRRRQEKYARSALVDGEV